MWTAFIDADEFINIAHYNSINEFLKQYDKVSVIAMDFVEFNANGQVKYEDKPVRERFTKDQKSRTLIMLQKCL